MFKFFASCEECENYINFNLHVQQRSVFGISISISSSNSRPMCSWSDLIHVAQARLGTRSIGGKQQLWRPPRQEGSLEKQQLAGDCHHIILITSATPRSFGQDDKTNIYAQSIKAGDYIHLSIHPSIHSESPIHPQDVLNRYRRIGAYFVRVSTPANVFFLSPSNRILRVFTPSRQTLCPFS